MVKNIAEHASFYCMNEHAEPVLMIQRARTDDNKDNFFACPKYMRKDEQHTNGFGEGETGCKNTLSFALAADILFWFNEMVETDMNSGIMSDYEGCKFTFKNQVEVTVLKDDGKELRFGVLNKKAIRDI